MLIGCLKIAESLRDTLAFTRGPSRFASGRVTDVQTADGRHSFTRLIRYAHKATQWCSLAAREALGPQAKRHGYIEQHDSGLVLARPWPRRLYGSLADSLRSCLELAERLRSPFQRPGGVYPPSNFGGVALNITPPKYTQKFHTLLPHDSP